MLVSASLLPAALGESLSDLHSVSFPGTPGVDAGPGLYWNCQEEVTVERGACFRRSTWGAL